MRQVQSRQQWPSTVLKITQLRHGLRRRQYCFCSVFSASSYPICLGSFQQSKLNRLCAATDKRRPEKRSWLVHGYTPQVGMNGARVFSSSHVLWQDLFHYVTFSLV